MTSANLLYKCKFCGRESTVDIVEGWEKNTYDEEDSGSMKRIVVRTLSVIFQCFYLIFSLFNNVQAFECRGLVPEEYEPRAGWTCKSSKSEHVFMEMELGDDWADYDENADESVAIYSFQSEFERA